MSLIGLTWSFSWYRTAFYKVFGVEAQQQGGHGHGQKESALKRCPTEVLQDGKPEAKGGYKTEKAGERGSGRRRGCPKAPSPVRAGTTERTGKLQPKACCFGLWPIEEIYDKLSLQNWNTNRSVFPPVRPAYLSVVWGINVHLTVIPLIRKW